MSNKDWNERQADSFSRRRNAQDAEFKRDYDSYYGKQRATGSSGRNAGGAGKGDRSRITIKSHLYDIGWELSFNKDLTDEQRAELTAEWHALKHDRA